MTIAPPLLALTLLLPGPAQAPAAAADPTASSLGVRRGERVILTRASTTGTLSGRVLRLGDDGLVIETGQTSQTVPYSDVQRIVRRRDSVWNGALIGYAVGFGAGAALVLADSCTPQPGALFDFCLDEPQFALAFGGLISGPIGMAAGTIGDALRRKPHVVFDRLAPRRATLQLTPTIRRGGGGVRATIGF